MRIVELTKFLEFRKKLDKRITLYYSSMLGIIIFVLFLLGDPLSAILFGIVTFGAVYGLIYGIRIMANNGAEKKRDKAVINGQVLDVMLKGELGLLGIEENKISYVSLQKFGVNKIPDIIIDEDLFIGIAKYKFGKLQKLKLGENIKCQLSFQAMPQGIFRIFDFYDVDGSFDKMNELLNQISRFNYEKYK